jgi:hypothetical protein
MSPISIARVAAGVKNEIAYRSASRSSENGVIRSSQYAISWPSGVSAARFAIARDGPPRYSSHGTASSNSGCAWA